MNKDSKLLQQNLDTSSTTYSYNGKQLFVREIRDLHYKGFERAIIRNVPVIQEKMDVICKFIDEIPNKIKGFEIITNERKTLYKSMLQIRLDDLLLPIYKELCCIRMQSSELVKSNIF